MGSRSHSGAVPRNHSAHGGGGAAGGDGRNRRTRRARARRVPRAGASPGSSRHHRLDSRSDRHATILSSAGGPARSASAPGNFTVQDADALLVLGSRLNIRQVSYNWRSFARGAFKIQVDVDAAELDKPTVRPDLPIHCDLKIFLREMLRQLPESRVSGAGPTPTGWRGVASAWRAIPWCSPGSAGRAARESLPFRRVFVARRWRRTTSWSALMPPRASCRTRRGDCNAISA